MTKAEKQKLKEELDGKVNAYFMYWNRDDYPDKPCVRRAVDTLQNTVFNLAEVMWHCGVITWEECCEYWAKVGIVEADEDEKCQYFKCGANENGVCKYVIEKRGNENGG